MTIKSKNIIKEGKIIQNYLVNFPQFIEKKPNCSYKLEIYNHYFSIFKIRIDQNEIKSVIFPFETKQFYDFVIYFGDNTFKRYKGENTDQVFSHTYSTYGQYTIKVYGIHNNLKERNETSQTLKKYNEVVNSNSYNNKNQITVVTHDITSFITQNVYIPVDIKTDQIDADYDSEDKKYPVIENITGTIQFLFLYNSYVDFRDYLTQIIYLGQSFTSLRKAFCFCNKLYLLPQQQLPYKVKDCTKTFYKSPKIFYLAKGFSFPQLGQNFESMFQLTSLLQCFNQNLMLPRTTKNCNSLFKNTLLRYMPKNLFNLCKKNITNLDYVFQNCSYLYNVQNFNLKDFQVLSSCVRLFSCANISKLDDDFELPKNIKNTDLMFHKCKNLQSIGNISIPQNIQNCYAMFFDCINLKEDVRKILNADSYKETSNFAQLFYNCYKLYGTVPQQKFWYNQHNNFNNIFYMFFNCTNLENYNYIPTTYGGNGNIQNLILYQIQIPGKFDRNGIMIPCFYALPLHYSDSNIKFKINYGDNNNWYQFNYQNLHKNFNDGVWINDQSTIFNGYSKCYDAIYDKKNNQYYSEYDRVNKYFNLRKDTTNYNFIQLDTICHIYKSAGKFTIKIKCQTPVQFYINQNDLVSNKYVTKIFVYQNQQDEIPNLTNKLTTYSHAWANAYNLQQLPNLGIPYSIKYTDYMFYLSDNLNENKVMQIPSSFMLDYKLGYKANIIDSSYMFYNFFKKYNNLATFKTYNLDYLPQAKNIAYTFYNCYGLSGSISSNWWNGPTQYYQKTEDINYLNSKNYYVIINNNFAQLNSSTDYVINSEIISNIYLQEDTYHLTIFSYYQENIEFYRKEGNNYILLKPNIDYVQKSLIVIPVYAAKNQYYKTTDSYFNNNAYYILVNNNYKKLIENTDYNVQNKINNIISTGILNDANGIYQENIDYYKLKNNIPTKLYQNIDYLTGAEILTSIYNYTFGKTSDEFYLQNKEYYNINDLLLSSGINYIVNSKILSSIYNYTFEKSSDEIYLQNKEYYIYENNNTYTKLIKNTDYKVNDYILSTVYNYNSETNNYYQTEDIKFSNDNIYYINQNYKMLIENIDYKVGDKVSNTIYEINGSYTEDQIFKENKKYFKYTYELIPTTQYTIGQYTSDKIYNKNFFNSDDEYYLRDKEYYNQNYIKLIPGTDYNINDRIKITVYNFNFIKTSDNTFIENKEYYIQKLQYINPQTYIINSNINNDNIYVESYIKSNDTNYIQDIIYYKKQNQIYIQLIEGSDYNIGDLIQITVYNKFSNDDYFKTSDKKYYANTNYFIKITDTNNYVKLNANTDYIIGMNILQYPICERDIQKFDLTNDTVYNELSSYYYKDNENYIYLSANADYIVNSEILTGIYNRNNYEYVFFNTKDTIYYNNKEYYMKKDNQYYLINQNQYIINSRILTSIFEYYNEENVFSISQNETYNKLSSYYMKNNNQYSLLIPQIDYILDSNIIQNGIYNKEYSLLSAEEKTQYILANEYYKENNGIYTLLTPNVDYCEGSIIYYEIYNKNQSEYYKTTDTTYNELSSYYYLDNITKNYVLLKADENYKVGKQILSAVYIKNINYNITTNKTYNELSSYYKKNADNTYTLLVANINYLNNGRIANIVYNAKMQIYKNEDSIYKEENHYYKKDNENYVYLSANKDYIVDSEIIYEIYNKNQENEYYITNDTIYNELSSYYKKNDDNTYIALIPNVNYLNGTQILTSLYEEFPERTFKETTDTIYANNKNYYDQNYSLLYNNKDYIIGAYILKAIYNKDFAYQLTSDKNYLNEKIYYKKNIDNTYSELTVNIDYLVGAPIVFNIYNDNSSYFYTLNDVFTSGKKYFEEINENNIIRYRLLTENVDYKNNFEIITGYYNKINDEKYIKTEDKQFKQNNTYYKILNSDSTSTIKEYYKMIIPNKDYIQNSDITNYLQSGYVITNDTRYSNFNQYYNSDYIKLIANVDYITGSIISNQLYNKIFNKTEDTKYLKHKKYYEENETLVQPSGYIISSNILYDNIFQRAFYKTTDTTYKKENTYYKKNTDNTYSRLYQFKDYLIDSEILTGVYNISFNIPSETKYLENSYYYNEKNEYLIPNKDYKIGANIYLKNQLYNSTISYYYIAEGKYTENIEYYKLLDGNYYLLKQNENYIIGANILNEVYNKDNYIEATGKYQSSKKYYKKNNDNTYTELIANTNYRIGATIYKKDQIYNIINVSQQQRSDLNKTMCFYNCYNITNYNDIPEDFKELQDE